MKENISRRKMVSAIGAGSIVAIAGCSTQDSEEDTEDSMGETDEESDEPASVSDDASVSFVLPEDGSTAYGGLTVDLDAENVDIVEAGTPQDGEGHYHLLIDREPYEEGETIDLSGAEYVYHYGDGSTDTVLDLPEGEHTVTVQVGDGQHNAFDVSEQVTVEVAEASATIETVEDGDTFESPVEVEFSTTNYDIEPASEGLSQNGGHAHLLVDHDYYSTGDTIPVGEDAEQDGVYHYGDGSTTAELDLEPGEHKIALQIGTGTHRATPVTDEIDIVVK